MDRKRRNIPRVDYRKMNGSESEVESDFSMEVEEEEMEFFSENEGIQPNGMEEGELWESGDEVDYLRMSESDFDNEVKEAIKKGDELKLTQLLAMKEKRCKQRQCQLEEAQKKENQIKKEEEKAKRKRMKEMQEKFKKLQKTESSLNRSLANSANSTPATSPRARPLRTYTSTKKSKQFKSPKIKPAQKGSSKTANTKKTKSRFDPTDSEEKRGEENLTVLDSLLNVKQGKIDKFAELMSQAMQASENLDYLRTDNKVREISEQKGKEFEKTVTPRCEQQLVNSPRGIQQLVDKLQLVKQAQTPDYDHGVEVQTQIVDLLKELRDLKLSNKKEATANVKDNTSDSELKDSENKKVKPVSGKLAKPDDTDIKKPVKFAHEKLDPRHARERVFDKLNFPLLIAGELELASRSEASSEEKAARVAIAKTLSYHKLYLNDEDLRIGYDTILKKIEQGILNWGQHIGEELHNLLDYRATVLNREKMNAIEQKMNKPNNSKTNNPKSDSKISDETATTEVPDEPEYKPIFCMEFNKNSCSFSKSHVGKWRGKKCTKWHICRACLKNNELNPHSESDKNCPCNKKD